MIQSLDNLVVLDCEIYPNYSLFSFKNITSGKVLTVEIKGRDDFLDDARLRRLKGVMIQRTTFGFNSRNYDMPVILYALRGKTAYEIYQFGDRVIKENVPGWKTLKDFGLVWPKSIKHFDIQEPVPGVKVSLKLYGGRMHSKRLQDLPIEPGSFLTEEDMQDTKDYCVNDLDTTIDLYGQIKDQMQLRIDMSNQYGQDLMSKSDAQIAEVVIKSELQKRRPGRYLKAPKLSSSLTFRYNVPSFISFQTPDLQKALEIIRAHHFEMDAKGSIKLPDELKKMKIHLGSSVYQLGVGGLHSKEKKQTVIPNENQLLIDKDVASYYPSIILNLGLAPKHLGQNFLEVYEGIVKTRLEAKRAKNDVVNKSLKIVINGSFGKLGSKYSALYSPDLMMTVTLTGQLALLMLIERLELHDISVVSANTDGFVSLLDKSQYELYDDICFDWELTTNFELEETRYSALYSRDVNNYLAVTSYGSKGKGIFTLDALSKNPQAPICIIAVQEYLINQTPIEDTIKNCDDITQFLSVRTVNGGAVWRGQYLGRVVRWIYSTNGDIISYKKNGNKCPKSDGSRPIMELGDFPQDIDYDRYISDANEVLKDIGLIT